MIDRLIAEATECDFKAAVEVKKPKSWLKSVSAFANSVRGTRRGRETAWMKSCLILLRSEMKQAN